MIVPLALLAACGGGSSAAGAASTSPVAAAVTAGGVTVDVVSTNSWQGGYNGALRITNVSFASPITSFSIVFKLNGTAGVAGSAWNGSFSSPDGSGNRTATNPDWLKYSPINKGASWDVGFNGSGTFSGGTIVSITINGQNIPIGTTVNNPPSVTLSASPTSVTAAGSVTLTASASDDKAVTKVVIAEGSTVLATLTSAPYTQTVSFTSSANNGTHTYTATAYDAEGLTATATAAVSVNIPVTQINQPPTVTLASSAATVTAAGSITLTANATDDKAVTKVVISEGSTVLATKTSAPYTQTVSFTSANNGTHTYTATAYDAEGLTATASVVVIVNIVVDPTNIPPTVSLSATPTSITADGNVTLTATASDSDGTIAKVDFYDGATLLVSDTASPYSFVGAMTSANNGTHSFTAVATDNKGASTTSTAVSVVVNITPTTTTGTWRVNSQGRLTKNGKLYPVHCGSWFGLQGRYEIASDAQNPRGAPMEQYVGNTFWASTHSRTVMQTMNEIKAAGVTVIRLPVVHQTLDATDPQGKNFLKNFSGIINDPTYPMRNAREGLESMIKAANAAGIGILLDIHSCSNYVDWRKGRLDARPPWVDSTRENYDYKREDCSCAADNNPSTVTRIQAYNESIWLQDLKTLAGLSKSLNVDNIVGIDIFNEPWDYSWTEWKTLIEHAYAAVNSVNPNLTIWAQGISGSHGNQLGVGSTPVATPHGTLNPNWGENLYEAGNNPPAIPKDQLVFSPHTYGPSVAVQPMFMDPTQTACTGLEGDAAAKAKCNIVINPTLLKQGWEEHFGYLKQLGYAVIVGEWGGNLDWPKGKSSTRDQQMWGYLPTTSPGVDYQWQNAFSDYMVSKGIESCYWSINPESGDTGGWYSTPYDPVSNTGGWGEWGSFDSRRTALLNKVWNGIP